MSTVVVSPGRSRDSVREVGAGPGKRAGCGWRCRRAVYLPAFSIVAVAVALIAIGWSTRWGGASFATSMTGFVWWSSARSPL